MIDAIGHSPHARALFRAAVATLALTATHHVYGGLLYATPWRLHGAVVALAFCLPLAALWRAYRRNAATPAGCLAGWTLAALAFVIPALVVGGFEGAWNHLAKDVLFFAGAPRDLLLRLFPPPAYELPNDVWFEVSGVAQVIPAALTALATVRFVRALRARRSRRIAAGAILPRRRLVAVAGESVCVPDQSRIVHLKFRRFAGCPVCSLHLRSITRRHEEIEAAGIREVVVFHAPEDELRVHVAGYPFAVIPDPDKKLYAEFGVDSSPRALLDPRAWPTIARAVARSLVAILRRKERAPAARPHGGRLGLPADFLIGPDGRVLACKYGEHANDQWTVDELLALAAAHRFAPSSPARAAAGMQLG